jgi:UDP-GlcNAc:undecaprenyl-phosphate GlcNAc-1-phosphate transferase
LVSATPILQEPLEHQIEVEKIAMTWTELATAGSAAFLISLILTPSLIMMAHRIGIVSHPRTDRWHQSPVALLGGVAIFSGFITAALLITPVDTQILSLLLGTALIFMLGMLDDLWSLSPQQKLIGQILASFIPVFNNIIFILPCNTLFSTLVTMLWIIGITNAFNLLDNMDGLAAGIAVISTGFMVGYGIQNHLPAIAMVAVCLGGAVLGFLPYNFNPARIFMGDSGSFVLGYVLATVTALGHSQLGVEAAWVWVAHIALLGLPIFDTCFVAVMRILHNRKIWQGGRDHTSHRLVALGLGEQSAVLVLYGISAMLASLSLLVRNLSVVSGLVLMFITLGLLIGFALLLAQIEVYLPEEQRSVSTE